jgi:hypothetical protein
MLSIQIPLLQRQPPYNSKKKPGGSLELPPVKKIECNIFKRSKIMQKTKKLKKQRTEKQGATETQKAIRKGLSKETLTLIKEPYELVNYQEETEQKLEKIIEAVNQQSNSDQSTNDLEFYVFWFNDFIKEIFSISNGDLIMTRFKLPKKAIELIEELYLLNLVFVKSDIFSLARIIDYYAENKGFSKRDKYEAIELLNWLNRFTDRLYIDLGL